jgi:hypothetical protein
MPGALQRPLSGRLASGPQNQMRLREVHAATIRHFWEESKVKVHASIYGWNGLLGRREFQGKVTFSDRIAADAGKKELLASLPKRAAIQTGSADALGQEDWFVYRKGH